MKIQDGGEDVKTALLPARPLAGGPGVAPAWSIPPMVRGISTAEVRGISTEEVQRREGCTASGEAWEEKTLVCGFVDGQEDEAAYDEINNREAERPALDFGMT